ncbi:MAG TPA: hypothetical protein VFB98_04215 [Candidatus Deferrimicrobium sp.]|nr:hypothetical protein [Candidatus Deferrimicrobium sp.]
MKARTDGLSAYLKSFRKRWNVEMNDKYRAEEFHNRALHTIASVLGSHLVDDEELSSDYLKIIGKPPEFDSWIFVHDVTQTPVWRALRNSSGIQEFIFLLESLFHLPFAKKTLKQMAAGLKEDITASGVQVVLAHSKDSYLFYPKGAKLLDERVVNADLEWLSDYPSALTAFENALVQSSDSAKQREVLDSLRVSLESLLKQLLGNRRSLENNKENLLKWMDERGTNTETRQMMSQLFHFYCNYQNEHVKHGDGWKPAEVNFILYLTATFISLLVELDR